MQVLGDLGVLEARGWGKRRGVVAPFKVHCPAPGTGGLAVCGKVAGVLRAAVRPEETEEAPTRARTSRLNLYRRRRRSDWILRK